MPIGICSWLSTLQKTSSDLLIIRLTPEVERDLAQTVHQVPQLVAGQPDVPLLTLVYHLLHIYRIVVYVALNGNLFHADICLYITTGLLVQMLIE